MRILVTAGNTQVPIDKVRCITNIFTGRTGTSIALEAHRRGHQVVLLTSHPEVVRDLAGTQALGSNWTVKPYTTFDDLRSLMNDALELGRSRDFDAIIHSAAIADYEVRGVYEHRRETAFLGGDPELPIMTERMFLVPGGDVKVKSTYPELWLRLEPTPKLVDMIRGLWGFRGVLVKFKLEVGVGYEELLEIAEKSRQQSQADLMVANTLAGKDAWACFGPIQGQYQRIDRPALATRVVEAVEDLHRQRTGG